MKFNIIVTALWIAAFNPASTSTSVDGSDDIVSVNVKEEHDVLETSHQLANTGVLDQKTQMSYGNDVSNDSSFNKQGQFNSISL